MTTTFPRVVKNNTYSNKLSFWFEFVSSRGKKQLKTIMRWRGKDIHSVKT
ncbi:MAG: hypothetical protein O4751_03275 [Trichodesmium sp. St2_bin6]|nr:hypothetical protein [Trichodesmium sp. St2_bin6]